MKRQSRGFALIVVAWYLVLLAAIGTYLLANARSETAIARNIRAGAGAEALADAGIALAVFNLTDPAKLNRWKLDGVPHAATMQTGELAIRVFDETAKINPNHASEALMAGLFQAAGVDRATSERLGATIADWVGPGDVPRAHGAKQEQYSAAGRSYGPPNAPVESLDELQLVLGMTPEIFASVRPYLTICTSGDEPNEMGAPPVIRQALKLARAAEAKDSGDSDDGDAQKPAAANPAAAGEKGEEQIVDIEITARSGDGGIFSRHAVVRLDPTDTTGYAVLDWRRVDSVLAANFLP